MKKKYNLIKLFFAFLILAGFESRSQALSGGYTINQAQSTGGTNFQNFTAFANAINTNGVSGPVNVTVVANSGPYNEQVQFTQATGLSATNKVTIYGNNNKITFSSSNFNQGWTILMNGADYYTFNNLNVDAMGSYGYAVCITNNGDYNTFSSCNFSVTANNSNDYQIPVVLSASSVYYYYSGTTGSFNTFNNCGLYNGYWNVMLNGGSSPTSTMKNNTFNGCLFSDFYEMSFYDYYCTDGTTVRSCTVECPTRTNHSYYKYGIYSYASQNFNAEGNWFRNFFQATPNYGADMYGIEIDYNLDSYYYGLSYPSRYPNNIKNNIISDMTNDGYCYGIMSYYHDGDIYNNTISLDYQSSSYGGAFYGMYYYGDQGYAKARVYNNIITVTRGGSGTRYGFFSGAGQSGTDLFNDRNDCYVTGSGSNFLGYYTGNGATLGALQSQGCMQNGFSVTPTYSNAGGMDYKPTNTAINNAASFAGLMFDQRNKIRNQSTPDIGAIEFLTPQCAGTPTLSISGPTYALCPGETANFQVTPLASAGDDGLTFQWQNSTISNVGPWTPISGATGLAYSAPNQTVGSFFSAVISCTAPGGGSVIAVAQVTMAATSQSTIPYFENFEGIGLANRLPNCSWSAPNMGSTQATYTSATTQNRLPKSGNSFATFNNSSAGTRYYYTNQIWMDAGVTYSASMWYQTDFTGASNWTDLRIMVGPNQSTTGLVTIAQTGPAISPVYKSLSNTYTVATSGYYYVAVRATGANGTAQYLTWDDLSIIIPCELNAPSVAVTPASATICSNASAQLTASGANTFAWSNGATTAVVSASAGITSVLNVTGTSTLTGCASTASVLLTVKNAPVITIGSYPANVCEGKPVSLFASGANTYTWTTGGVGSAITVTANGAASYSVNGTNANNCIAQGVIQIQPNPTPTISVTGNYTMCSGEQTTLTASGGANYKWMANNNYLQTNPVTIVAGAAGTVVYTVTGVGAANCEGSAIVSLTINECTGLTEFSNSRFVVYPNPTNGDLNIVHTSGVENVTVSDMTGRIIMNATPGDNLTTLSLSELAAGVYYITVSGSSLSTQSIKVIKN